MDLWTRRPVCGPRAEVIDRLSALRSAGRVAEFEVRTWPDELVLSKHADDTPALEAYERFQQWAADAGVSLAPSFERRTVSSLLGGSREVVRLPVVCLAVYGEDLGGVYPCQGEDRSWTVGEFLDAYGGDEAACHADPPGLADLEVE